MAIDLRHLQRAAPALKQSFYMLASLSLGLLLLVAADRTSNPDSKAADEFGGYLALMAAFYFGAKALVGGLRLFIETRPLKVATEDLGRADFADPKEAADRMRGE